MDRSGRDRQVGGDGGRWRDMDRVGGDELKCREMDRGGRRWTGVGGRNREVGTNGEDGTPMER